MKKHQDMSTTIIAIILRKVINVGYLYQPGELEGGTKRATDPIWFLKVYKLKSSVTGSSESVVCYFHDVLKRDFVREELLVVPPNTQLPTAYVI